MSSPDLVAAVLLWTGLLLLAAWLGGRLAERARQPAVLGELLAGIVLAALVSVDARAEVDEGTTSTLVLVVLATTLVAPPLLRWRLR